MLGTLSHIIRLSTPLPSGSKTVGPRKLQFQCDLYALQYPPDGGNVGIINHLAIIASITTNVSGLYDALIDVEL